ncbi:MAG: HlyC/CorC family transporter [Caldilineaceae bacterium]|nr:HlyC/CorC family transporter [Caldilineaceae bacterium]
MDLFIVLAILVFLIAINGFYVAAEFSTVSAQRSRLSQLADQGDGGAKRVLGVIEDAHKLDAYIAACQLGITLSSLILGFYGQARLAQWVEPVLTQVGGGSSVAAQSISATLILLVLTVLQVIFGELTPKNIGLQYPERLAIYTSVPMEISVKLFQPLIWLFNGSGQLLLRLMGTAPVAEHAHIHSPEEIMLMVEESSAGGVLDREERRLLVNTLQLRNITARKAMLPRNRILAAPIDTPCEELYETLSTSPYSRLLLYEETIDEIVGMVHLRDLMLHHYRPHGATESAVHDSDNSHVESEQTDSAEFGNEGENMTTHSGDGLLTPRSAGIVNNIEYVPDSMLIEDVMTLMQQKRTNVAVVVDEYGGTAGMITFEDLVEEIIGEFQDEFDAEDPPLTLKEGNRMFVRGDVLIEDLNDLLGLYLPSEHVDTIGGLVTSELGFIPTSGEEITIGTTTLRVEKMEQNSVTEVSFELTPEQLETMDEHSL